MEQTYVTKQEFEKLEKKVESIEVAQAQNIKILTEIDGKVSLINEKLTNQNAIEDLKLTPLKKRVEDLEESQKWTWRAFGGAIIGVIVKLVFDVSKLF